MLPPGGQRLPGEDDPKNTIRRKDGDGMNIRFRNRPAGAAAGTTQYHPHQVWRTSGVQASRHETLPRVRAVLAAVAVVGLLTLGLHMLFD